MDKKGIIKKYKCGWCGFEFERQVVYVGGDKKGAYSSIVICPNPGCGRTIPTWKREETENIVGRKHIHPDR